MGQGLSNAMNKFSSSLYGLCKPSFDCFTLTFPRTSLFRPYIANPGIAMNVKIMPADDHLSSTTVQYQRQELKMASVGLVDLKFPVGSLVPKAETNCLNFLQKYPEYDGRDVTIAILDSGVDPRVAGLQNVINGDIKVIERFDCSGCGDTDTTKKVSADDKSQLVGLSGRSLKITPFMKSNNKDGNEYRIGLKSLHDLYPSKIREKIANEEKAKVWDPHHKIATADALRQLQSFEAGLSDSQNLTLKEKLTKEDLDGCLDLLNNLEKKYLDTKTSFDCVLFKTDQCWYAVIDTSETGDLENGVLIGEYSKTHEVKKIDNYLSVSINVHDDGNVLEIVGMCSSHGTHVASIASGNHEDKELDGVAPNAKIISLTIGDGRLGSMETGTALVRAIIKVMELCNAGTKIDVINMSYGEHAAWSNSGRVGSLMNEVVNKYGVVWVASAGNHGPALCTIGTPPDISQPSCIGVGAYVSPQMMEAEYALREKLPANVYTWTSRDPCIDGGQGVTVCAPGAAITSVPEYTMARAQLMNGTSMAAPHVAGAIALLISGLKQRNIKYSPYSIKRAIWNTATKLDYVDTFAQGNGLLNVEKAFENLIQYANQQENLIRFSVRVGNQNAKGIHIRQGSLRKAIEYNVTVEPIFLNEKETDPKDKINFNVRLALVPSEPWVQCGHFLDLCYVSRSILVRVDPTGLSEGVHRASVKAYDTMNIEKGPLFEIPITVVQPIVIYSDDPKKLMIHKISDFKPNTISRTFISVPENATWAVLRMISSSERDNDTGKFFVHTMQILPYRYCKSMETMKILPVNNQNDTVHAFKCEQNNILELCIAKYWSNFGETQLKFTLEFHGITSNGTNNVMHSANGIHRIDISSLGNEEISPGAQLKTAAMVLRPSENKVSPLSSRDIIPDGRQIYQNVLTYNLHLTKGQEVSVQVPMLSSVLYESEYESQFWMLFDSNKLMLASGDAYSGSQYSKLEKGDYVIKLQVRHEKKDILEKISEATVLVTFKLQSPITLDIYEHYNQAIVGGKKASSFLLHASSAKTLYIAPLSTEKLNKSSLPAQCSWLNGSVAYAKDDVGRKCDNNSLQYILTEGPPVKKTNGSSPKKNNNKPKSEEYTEGLRDYQCSMISKLDQETAEQVYKEILAGFPKHFPAHLAFIQMLESTDNTTNFPFAFAKSIGTTTTNSKDADKIDVAKITASLNRIVEIASIVINETDQDALLTYYGMKTDTRPDAAKIKTNMDRNKSNLIEAYCKKGIALCKLATIESEKSKESASSSSEDIDAIFIEIGKFIDPMDLKAIYFSLWHAYIHLQYGRMAKCFQKLYEDKANKEITEELQSLTLAKNWNYIIKQLRRTVVHANPVTYRPF